MQEKRKKLIDFINKTIIIVVMFTEIPYICFAASDSNIYTFLGFGGLFLFSILVYVIIIALIIKTIINSRNVKRNISNNEILQNESNSNEKTDNTYNKSENNTKQNNTCLSLKTKKILTGVLMAIYIIKFFIPIFDTPLPINLIVIIFSISYVWTEKKTICT